MAAADNGTGPVLVRWGVCWSHMSRASLPPLWAPSAFSGTLGWKKQAKRLVGSLLMEAVQGSEQVGLAWAACSQGLGPSWVTCVVLSRPLLAGSVGVYFMRTGAYGSPSAVKVNVMAPYAGAHFYNFLFYKTGQGA